MCGYICKSITFGCCKLDQWFSVFFLCSSLTNYELSCFLFAFFICRSTFLIFQATYLHSKLVVKTFFDGDHLQSHTETLEFM